MSVLVEGGRAGTHLSGKWFWEWETSKKAPRDGLEEPAQIPTDPLRGIEFNVGKEDAINDKMTYEADDEKADVELSWMSS